MFAKPKLDDSVFDAVAALEKTWSSTPWSAEDVRSFYAQDHSYLFTLTEGDDLLGYLTVRSVCDEAEIVNLAISPLHRRKGLAARLLNNFLEDCKRESVTHITLEVRVSNTPARRLYEACGFAPLATRKNFYSAPKEDGLIYGKDL